MGSIGELLDLIQTVRGTITNGQMTELGVYRKKTETDPRLFSVRVDDDTSFIILPSNGYLAGISKTIYDKGVKQAQVVTLFSNSAFYTEVLDIKTQLTVSW
jgi:hypothetical protein